MRLSVVIPCYNAESVIGDQLEALARQKYTHPWEIVVSDNGSTDGSRAVVKRFQSWIPNLLVVDSSASPGAAGARNEGIRHARGDLILTCDADDVAGDGYVARMADALEAHDFVAGRLEEKRLNAPWLTASWVNGQAGGLLQSTPTFLPFAAGASLGFRRRVFDQVGGFDPGFRKREDQDFCWRVQLAGTSLHFVPEAVMHYRYPTRLREMYLQSRALAEDAVHIARQYELAMPRPRKRGCWRKLVRRLPGSFVNAASAARFVRDLGHEAGRLRGLATAVAVRSTSSPYRLVTLSPGTGPSGPES